MLPIECSINLHVIGHLVTNIFYQFQRKSDVRLNLRKVGLALLLSPSGIELAYFVSSKPTHDSNRSEKMLMAKPVL